MRPALPLLLTCLACTTGARAAELSAELTQASFSLRERLPNGQVFSQDRGSLPGLRLGLQGTTAAGWGWAVQGWHQASSVGYSGLNQLLLPITSRTDLRLTQADLSLRLPWRPAWGEWQLSLAGALQGLRLERGIRASPLSLATTEVLESSALQVEATLHAPMGAARWQLAATLGWPLHQRLAVDTGVVLPRYALRPSGRVRGSLSLQVQWPLAAHWSLAVRADAAQVRYGPAPQQVLLNGGRVVGASSYPGGTHRLGALAVGLSTRW